ncbi:MAG: hypothetical protein BroJett021_33700 [Chloroflexota bacterium]|nr:MAG: hypothetical protein BroJett021_33700 [Chloroflexota bacterium]
MSENNDREDVFADPEASQEDLRFLEDHEGEESHPEPKKKRRFSPAVLIGAGVAVIFVGFVAFRMLSPKQMPPMQASSPAPTVAALPTDGAPGPVAALPAENRPGGTDRSLQQPNVPSAGPSSPSTMSAGALPATDAIPQPKAAEPSVTKADIMELAARLDGLGREVAALKAAADGKAKVKPASRPAAAAKAETVRGTPPPKSAAKAKTESQTSHAVAGVKVKNITPGQAWLEDAEGQVKVVGVGDAVFGLSVLKIDADSGRVTTDKGVISF